MNEAKTDQAQVVRPSANESGFPDVPPEKPGQTPAQELADIAAEMGMATPAVRDMDTPEPTKPDTPIVEAEKAVETPAPEPQVPEKFKDGEGNLDTARLAKSTQHAEAALAKYEELEKTLRRKQAEAHRLQMGQPDTTQHQPTTYPPGFEGLAKQIEDGVKMEGLPSTLARLFAAAENSAYARAREDVMSIAEKAELRERREELREIARNDSWVISPEGQKILMELRQENPWIGSSPSPWQSAYELAKGRGLVPNSGAAVKMPTPTPKGGAPVPPPSGPRPNKPTTPNVDLSDPQKLNAYLDGLTPQEEAKFWQAQGVAKGPYI